MPSIRALDSTTTAPPRATARSRSSATYPAVSSGSASASHAALATPRVTLRAAEDGESPRAASAAAPCDGGTATRTAKAGAPFSHPRSPALSASDRLSASSIQSTAALWLSQAAAQASTERITAAGRPAIRMTRCQGAGPSSGPGWTAGRPVKRAQASSFSSSTESIGMPMDVTPMVASTASCAEANVAATVASFAGEGTILNVASAMTASVPSPPT